MMSWSWISLGSRARGRRAPAVLAAAIGLLAAGSAWAQKADPAPAGPGSVPSAGRQAPLGRAEAGVIAGATVQRDADTGRIRRVRGDIAPLTHETAAAAARAFLYANRKAFGLSPDLAELRLLTEAESPGGFHVRYDQAAAGLPVFGGSASVHLNRAFRIVWANLDLIPINGAPRPGPAGRPDHAVRAALAAVAAPSGPRREPVATEGWFITKGLAEHVYRVTFPTTAPSGDWVVMVRIADLKPLSVRNDARYAEGSGMVYLPNPIVVTGNPTLTDLDNADTPTLTGARASVPILGLDGSGYLQGQFCTTAPSSSITRAYSATGTFNFTRSQSGFDETMAYYHIDRVARHLHSLGFTGVQNRQTGVDVNGTNEDNAWYTPSTKELTFGSGGVNDAQDAHVIWHECGHAIQDDQVPGFGAGYEAGAIGEGFGDYWALTQFTGIGPMGAAWDLYVAEWDASAYSSTVPPYLRRMDSSKHYPEDMAYEVHDDGEMWSACLWQLRALVGAVRADRIILESHFLLSPTCYFADGALAILAANQALYADADRRAIRGIFIDRGFLDGEVVSDLSVTTVAAHPGEATSLSALLVRADTRDPIAGADIAFALQGSSLGAAATGADGFALMPYTVPSWFGLGYRAITARYAGTWDYSKASASGVLNVVGYAIRGTVTEGGFPLPGVAIAATGPGVVTKSFSVAPGTSIPDADPNGLASKITVPDTGALEAVRVNVDISHTYIGDLLVTLVHPDGTRVVLHNHAGAGADDLVTSYPDLTAPDQSLDALVGKPANGVWTLEVADAWEMDTGTLNAWGLALTMRSDTAVTSAVTDDLGEYRVEVLSGAFSLSAAKAGFAFSPASRSVSVPPEPVGQDFAALGAPSQLLFSDVTGYTGEPVTLAAHLRDRVTLAPLGGQTVAFTVAGVDAGSNATLSDGTASVAYTLPAGLLKGSHALSARYAGSASYNPAAATATLTVPGFSVSGHVMQVGGPLAGATVAATAVRSTESAFSIAPGQSVPDNDESGVTSTLTVPDVGTIQDICVAVDISHTWIGDLAVSLKHPDGTTVLLHNHGGGSSDDIVTSYPDLTVPASSLGVLIGKPSAGDWKLVVVDNSAYDTGRLNAWGLTITSEVLQTVESATSGADGAYTLPGLDPGAYTVTASLPGVTLTPASRSVTVGPSATGIDFASSTIATALAMPNRAGMVSRPLDLFATLTQVSAGAPLAGKTVAFTVVGTAAGSAVTNASGLATLTYTLPESAAVGGLPKLMTAEFARAGDLMASSATATLTLAKAGASVYVPDRSQVITQTVALKAYLKRTTDNAWLAGRTVAFSVAGTAVGTATTSAAGEAALNWVVDAGAATRTLRADYAGEAAYDGAYGAATLTATTVPTKVYVVDRLNVKIKTYTVLKAYLYTLTNAIVPGKTLTMTIDGTSLGSQPTNSSGYVSFGYTVPEGVGAGNRVVGAGWAGNAGYPASSNTGKLGVVQGNLYIWPYVRSGKRGTVHPLKAYVRSLPDYVIQPGKSITFKVGGSTIGSANVAADGWATVNWSIPVGEPTGSHTATAEFAGDSWYAAVVAGTAFNVVP